jgi:hypothetical protein
MSDEQRDDPREDGSTPAGHIIDRRRFLQVSGAGVAAVGGGLAATGTARARSRTAQQLAPATGDGSRPELATPGKGRPAIPTDPRRSPRTTSVPIRTPPATRTTAARTCRSRSPGT